MGMGPAAHLRAALLVAGGLASCASPDGAPAAPRGGERGDHYLRLVAVRDQYNDTYVLHWRRRAMPLSVYLPPPPADLFEDPGAIADVVREAVLDWSDVAAPGVPSFEFVESHGAADIPIVWAAAPDGDWYIAFCSYQINVRQRRFGVEQILVTGRWGDGRVADLHDVYATVLHEMGHALGLTGHSDDPADAMFPTIPERASDGLSERDRNTLRLLYARPSRQIRGRRGARH